MLCYIANTHMANGMSTPRARTPRPNRGITCDATPMHTRTHTLPHTPGARSLAQETLTAATCRLHVRKQAPNWGYAAVRMLVLAAAATSRCASSTGYLGSTVHPSLLTRSWSDMHVAVMSSR
mmetsp:Transcript_77997/g.155015  ORF Transcript_77997/g.155015 Transcript_77997/m.155015 type:complete len:122 (+) Transcript_77997:36-401(+)